MRFEWDEKKNRLNLRKHGISFEAAAQVFDDPFSVTIQDCQVLGEMRYWTVGRILSLILVVVVHTIENEGSGEMVRIISARKATSRERRLYEQEKD